MSRDLYDQDFVAWTEEQARRLRAGDLAGLDLKHLAEEIESVGSSERRDLRSRLIRLLQQLLKWQFQPEHRSCSWSATIRQQRDDLAALLADSPSLRRRVPEILPAAYRRGRDAALEETGLLHLPETCPWTMEQVLGEGFLPE